MKIKSVILMFSALVLSLVTFAQNESKATAKIPEGAKVYIAKMPNDFDTYIKAAIEQKKVPVQIVGDKSQAEYQLTGVSETQKAGAAKKALLWDWRSTEDASIQVANLASGEVVFAYSVHLQSSNRGRKSAAESCAKHLKEFIEKGK